MTPHLPHDPDTTSPKPGAARGKRPGGPARAASIRHLAPCGLVKRADCERHLAALLEGSRADRVALRRVGRQNCAIFQCLEERGAACCLHCAEHPCVFHEHLDRICPGGNGLALESPSRSWRVSPTRRSRPEDGAPTDASSADGEPRLPRGQVPERTVFRLRWYLAALEHFHRAGLKLVSSAEIAAKVGVGSSLVRRDLCHFGQFGTRSLGYEVEEVLTALLSVFALARPRRVVWVGAELLRQNAGASDQFSRQNWEIAAVLDPDPDLVGTTVGEHQVLSLSRLEAVLSEEEANTAVLATPASVAQATAERLVTGGVSAILNLAPSPISVPEHVAVQQADLATQLMLLSYQASLLAGAKVK